MPELFGGRYTRAELLRRVGRLEQVAGVRLVTLGDGLGRGVRVLEFRTGTGFASTCWSTGPSTSAAASWADGRWAGYRAPGSSRPGTTSPTLGWFRAWGGGMVVTCGLDHTLVGGEDTATHFNQPHIRATVRSPSTAGSADCPPAWSATANAGRATNASCGRRARSSSRRSSASTSSFAGGSRRGSARAGSRSTTRSRTSATTGPATCSCTTATPAGRSSPSRRSFSSRAGRTTTDYGVPIEGYATSRRSASHRGVLRARAHRRAGRNRPRRGRQPGPGLGVYQVFRIDQLPTTPSGG